MLEYNYLLDERSETILKECQNKEVDLQKLLDINFMDIL